VIRNINQYKMKILLLHNDMLIEVYKIDTFGHLSILSKELRYKTHFNRYSSIVRYLHQKDMLLYDQRLVSTIFIFLKVVFIIIILLCIVNYKY